MHNSGNNEIEKILKKYPVIKTLLQNDDEIIEIVLPSKIMNILVGTSMNYYGFVIWYIFLLIMYLFLLTASATGSFNETKSFTLFLILVSYSIFLYLLLMLYFIYNNLYTKNELYIITNKGILFQYGFLGLDYKMLDHDKIVSLELETTPFANMLGLKTININSNAMWPEIKVDKDSYLNRNNFIKMYFLKDSENIFKKLHTISLDMRADIHFPNAYRDDVNPGNPSIRFNADGTPHQQLSEKVRKEKFYQEIASKYASILKEK